MIKMSIKNKTSINVNESSEGETIEQKIERIVTNGEPIEDSAPIIWQERKEGINPAYDIRTDRWEIAIEAMTNVAASQIAKREEPLKTEENKEEKSE